MRTERSEEAWRWSIDDAMMVNGLTADNLWPVVLAAACRVAGWKLVLHCDLET